MQVSEFKGIQQYHDGRPVADYCNVIPLGSSAIDRYGESICYNYTEDPLDPVIETFVDSRQNIYVCTRSKLFRYFRRGNGWDYQFMRDLGFLCERASFCESSTKPSQVYFCDGRNVFYWNLENSSVPLPSEAGYRGSAFVVTEIPFYTNPDDITINGQSLDSWMDANAIPENNDPMPVLRGWWPTSGIEGAKNNISSIAWFDNRLILVQTEKNTVWLSAIDPSRFTQPTFEHNGYYYPVLPWQVVSSQQPNSYMNAMFPNYYISTASSAVLQDVVAFAGNLYFLNNLTIEVWSATGNDSNPIQHNSQNTLYYGGRSPVIIDDTLYLICKGAIHNDFIAAINQNGAIEKVSNAEIELRLQPETFRLRPLSIRDQAMIVAYCDEYYRNGFAMTKEKMWWRYFNNDSRCIAWSLINVDGSIVGISKYGSLLKADESTRKFVDGSPVIRSVRGGFIQFAARKILREVEVICDTGVYMDASMARPKLYLRVSFNRGLGFGPYLYRALGAFGTNNRQMLWRNCGSGNSLLLEFGTSDDVRFQIYGLRFELG